MLITNKNFKLPQYVMIRSAKMRTDRDTKSTTKTNTSTQSKYQDERTRLQQLIIMSMQNPNNMEAYLTQFLDQKKTLSSSFQNTRSRVQSQPLLDSKVINTPQKKTIQTRRQSHLSRVDTSPKSPMRTPSTNSRCLMYSFNSELDKKKPYNTTISKLSTGALIDYHKQLVLKAQKLIVSCKKKQQY